PPSREWPAEVVPEAEVGPEPDTTDDRLDRGVEQPREVGRRVRVDGRRRVVDLDVVRALGHEAFQLGAEDRYERFRRGVARGVDLVLAGPQPARQRVRPGQRHLQRPPRSRTRVAVLLDDTETVRCRDRLEDLEAVLLVMAAGAQTTVGNERTDASHVLVELRGEEPG